jgi:hypothetical protein
MQTAALLTAEDFVRVVSLFLTSDLDAFECTTMSLASA